MNAERTAELVLVVLAAATSGIVALNLLVRFAQRGSRVARWFTARLPAFAVGALTVGFLAASSPALASVSDPPPATLTLDDTGTVAALESSPQPTSLATLPAPPDTTRAQSTYTVVAGDNFWAIALRIATTHDAAVSPSSIGAYWLRLIAANRDRLVERTNPSLIYPGQVIVVPEP